MDGWMDTFESTTGYSSGHTWENELGCPPAWRCFFMFSLCVLGAKQISSRAASAILPYCLFILN
ncbi:hypothetical protein B0T26DRAFT_710553 [Lasiosphaeria miniovina]|uniref:Uncharacterized protein n=1 Tax=Lasiosphaeria miniovina TaxID=1954250 RepID=A0AA40AKT6_9PEZI|nr:uncharacterized protein B0T26DRAFT_710553 [Lasiosphaeria miniovina]KAK0717674.1 hypothetical protein B0T26DRAFT_710553 [Lasiosphaeria miniovina]